MIPFDHPANPIDQVDSKFYVIKEFFNNLKLLGVGVDKYQWVLRRCPDTFSVVNQYHTFGLSISTPGLVFIESQIKQFYIRMSLIVPTFTALLSVLHHDKIRDFLICSSREEDLRFNLNDFWLKEVWLIQPLKIISKLFCYL